jgi:hypothetical protein
MLHNSITVMKSFPFLAACVALLGFNPSGINISITENHIDTSHIIHVLDGLVNEWPADKFFQSPDSTIEYAVDNDSKYLYLAISVPEYSMQTKLMRNGMKIFIDTRGKKKEGKGIEFPVKGEVSPAGINTFSSGNKEQEPAQQKKNADRKMARNIMALSLNALKLFGFPNQQPEQGLIMPGSVNIMFKWDSLDIMHIEYNIPLELLGDLSSSGEREISLGWKINGFERPATGDRSYANPEETRQGGGFSRERTGGGGRGGYGGARGFNGAGRQGSSRHMNIEEMGKEQNFWAKYILAIAADKKPF